ncbi:MAG: Branched-chain amino acid transport ATP-binding protein LivF [uncultured Sphingomonas sp.]|uniref:Branched-chain amino acid transport ATP-binding protein LivF n=1 Tax=uncultured Sphingomonas sp. TaxID=158754 RepID=A0A6J4T837_9SPHN|nr:MAG: Branched-chain amino acid transport ATP-binding protein LivF [uncultured Sphingomonas sp.]
MSPVLFTTEFEVRYGANFAVRGVTLTVARGEITTIIGANGAGKTSLLAGLAGFERRRGLIQFDGRDISRASPEDNARAGLILVPETRDLFASMSVRDNLLLGAALGRPRLRDDTAQQLECVLTRFPPLAARQQQHAGTLSGGERQMLALGRALMGRPKLLMLDEPSLGLAPNLVQQMFKWIAALKAEGTSILLVEQNARMALTVAEHAYVMEHGQLSTRERAGRLAAQGDIAARYLGRRTRRAATVELK